MIRQQSRRVYHAGPIAVSMWDFTYLKNLHIFIDMKLKRGVKPD